MCSTKYAHYTARKQTSAASTGTFSGGAQGFLHPKDKVGGAKTPQYLNKVNQHVFVVCPVK